MRYSLLPFVLITIFCGGSESADGQEFDYDAYQPRTLAEVIKKYDNQDVLEGESGNLSMVFGASFPSQVKVIYTGSSRKISAERKAFIDAWAKTRGLQPEIAGLFETEHLFIENSVEHWLPTQKQVASFFDDELKKGDQITLFVIIAGGKKIDGKWNWIILVNEFEK